MTPIFDCTIKDGKLKLKDKTMFDMYVSTLSGEYQVMVQKPRRQRSNPQNRYYRGPVIKALSEHTGYKPDEMHEILKMKFNSKTVHMGKDEIKIAMSTASLSTVAFNEYLSNIIMWASQEHGVIITDPEKVMGFD